MDIMLERIVQCIGDKHGAAKALADFLGIHPNIVTNWKNGRNRSYRGRANEIASYFDVSVDYIKGLTDDPRKTKKPATPEGNELTDEEREHIRLYRAASPEFQAAALAMLEAAEKARLAQDSSSKDK